MTALLPAPTPSAPVVFRPRCEPPPDPVEEPDGHPVDGSGGSTGDPPGPDHAAGGLPGAGAAVTGLLRMLVEVFDGRRPPSHLAAHLDPGPLGYWRAVTERRPAARARRGRPVPPERDRRAVTHVPARLARIHRCHPCPQVAEVAVSLRYDDTVCALAARFEADRTGRWRCTVLRLL